MTIILNRKCQTLGVQVMAQRKWIWLTSMRTQVRSQASLSGLRLRCCYELWCRSQMRLKSSISVALVQDSVYSSDSTPRLRTFICQWCGSKKTRKKIKGQIYKTKNPEMLLSIYRIWQRFLSARILVSCVMDLLRILITHFIKYTRPLPLQCYNCNSNILNCPHYN